MTLGDLLEEHKRQHQTWWQRQIAARITRQQGECSHPATQRSESGLLILCSVCGKVNPQLTERDPSLDGSGGRRSGAGLYQPFDWE